MVGLGLQPLVPAAALSAVASFGGRERQATGPGRTVWAGSITFAKVMVARVEVPSPHTAFPQCSAKVRNASELVLVLPHGHPYKIPTLEPFSCRGDSAAQRAIFGIGPGQPLIRDDYVVFAARPWTLQKGLITLGQASSDTV